MRMPPFKSLRTKNLVLTAIAALCTAAASAIFSLSAVHADQQAVPLTASAGNPSVRSSSETTTPIMGFAEYAGNSGGGFKALIFDSGKGFVFRPAAPNRVDTWEIQLTDAEAHELARAFTSCSFADIPSKLWNAQKQDVSPHISLFYADDALYHEVKDCAVENASFEKIKTQFDNLLKQKVETATRVPITLLLGASREYQDTHPANSCKARCVRNITSDMCRELSAAQELDYQIAKDYFLPDRYLQDVDFQREP